ncbi:MAG: hypothetical protein ACKERG_02400 [Candidatus Hodgkinia cicadicola]
MKSCLRLNTNEWVSGSWLSFSSILCFCVVSCWLRQQSAFETNFSSLSVSKRRGIALLALIVDD